MAENTVNVKLLDMPEFQAVIKAANDKIAELQEHNRKMKAAIYDKYGKDAFWDLYNSTINAKD